MSIILPNEVEPELNDENELGGLTRFALLPSKDIGSGNVLTEISSGVGFTFPENVIWNADGSISPTTTSSANRIEVGQIPNLNAKSFLYWIDFERGANNAHLVGAILDIFSNASDQLNYTTGSYGANTLYSTGTLNNSNASNFGDGNGVNQPRAIYLLHYNSATGLREIYKGTELLASATKAPNPWGASSEIKLGIGSANDKFYGCGFLLKDGEFSASDIEELGSNPYSTFKSTFDTEQENALVFDGTNRLVAIDELVVTDKEDWSLEWKCEPNYGSFDYVLGSVIGSTNLIYIRIKTDSGTGVVTFRIYTSGTATDINAFITTATSGVHTYKVISSTALTSLYIDGELLGTQASTKSPQCGLIGNSRETSFSSFKLHWLRYTDSVAENSRFWEFNQATNTPFVRDHYNGAIAELVGFDAYSGYVRAWGMSEGLEFNSSESQYVTISIDHPPSLNWELTFDLDLIEAVGGWYRLASDGTGAQRLLIKEDLTELRHYRNSNEFNFTGLSLSLTDVLTLKAVNGTKLELLINGVSAGFSNNTQTYTGISYTFFGRDSNGYGSFNVRSLSFLTDTAEYNRYYNFKAIKGSSLVVPEEINGQDGTMVGWSENGVFVPEKTKDLITQVTNGVDSYVQFNEITLLTGDTLTVKFIAPTSKYTDNAYLLSGSGTTSSYIFVSTGGLIWFISSRTTVEFDGVPILTGAISLPYDGLEHTFKLTLINSSNTSRIGTDKGVSKFGEIKFLSYNVVQSGVEALNLDFTKEAGNTILDTSGNDNHGMVIGGELQRIYGNYSGFGEFVGYQVTKDTQLSTLHKFPNDFRVTIPVQYSTSSTKVFLTSDGTTSDTYIRRASNNSFGVWIGGVNLITSNGWWTSNTRVVYLTFERIAGVFNWYQDGVLKGGRLAAADSSTGAFTIQHIKPNIPVLFTNTNTEFSDLTNPSNSLNFDFTTGEMSARIGGTWEPYIVEANGNHGKLVGGVTAAYTIPDTLSDNNGTLVGNTGFNAINVSNGLKLNGTSELISIASFTETNDFTIKATVIFHDNTGWDVIAGSSEWGGLAVGVVNGELGITKQGSQDGIASGLFITVGQEHEIEFRFTTANIEYILDGTSSGVLVRGLSSIIWDFNQLGKTDTSFANITLKNVEFVGIESRNYDFTQAANVGATFDGSTGNIQFNDVTITADFELDFEVEFLDATQQIACIIVDNNKWIGIWQGSFISYIGGVIITLPTKPSQNVRYLVKVKRVGTTITLSANGESNTGEVSGTVVVNSFEDGSPNGNFKLYDTLTIKESNVLTTNFNFTKTIDIQTGGTVQPVIKETIQGKHAIISGGSTTGFQPIIEKIIYTAGLNKDYTYLNEAIEAQKFNANGHIEIQLDRDHTPSARAYCNSTTNFLNGLTIRGMKGAFDGDVDGDSAIKLDIVSAAFTNYFIYDKSQRITFINLNVHQGNIELVYYAGGSGYNMKGCGLYSVDGNVFTVSTGGKYNFYDTYFKRENYGYVLNMNGSTFVPSFYNCAFTGELDGIYPLLRSRYHLATYVNCIALNRGDSPTFGHVFDEMPVLGSNNISNDSTAVDEGIGTQDASLSSYFDANGQVNEAGQTAFEGLGFNGADLITWAYASIDSGGITTVTTAYQVSFDALAQATIETGYQIKVDLLGQLVVEADYQISVTLHDTVITSNTISLSLLERFDKLLAYDFDLLAQAETSNSTVLDLLGRNVISSSIKFSLLEQAAKSYQVNCDLLSQNIVVTPFTILVNLNEQIKKSTTVDIKLLNTAIAGTDVVVDMLQRFDKTLTIDLDFLSQQQVITPFSVLVDIREQVTSEFRSNLDLLERVTGDCEIVATLLNVVTMDLISNISMNTRVTKDLISKIDLNAQITTNYNLSLDCISRVGSVFNVVFTVDSGRKTPYHYTISAGRVVSFNDQTITLDFTDKKHNNFII